MLVVVVFVAHYRTPAGRACREHHVEGWEVVKQQDRLHRR